MPEPKEAAIQRAVIQHWKVLGRPDTLVAAIPNQFAFGQAGLTKGLSDLMCIGGTVRVGFLELKRVGGRPSKSQLDFQSICRANGVPCEIVYGRDEPIAWLERWEIVRRSNVRPS